MKDISNPDVSQYYRNDRVNGSFVATKVFPMNWTGGKFLILLAFQSAKWEDQV